MYKIKLVYADVRSLDSPVLYKSTFLSIDSFTCPFLYLVLKVKWHQLNDIKCE